MIHKSATKAAEITWTNGNKVSFFLSSNRNTGDRIVFQKVDGRRSSRITGKNLKLLANELRAITPADGTVAVFSEAAWNMILGG